MEPLLGGHRFTTGKKGGCWSPKTFSRPMKAFTSIVLRTVK